MNSLHGPLVRRLPMGAGSQCADGAREVRTPGFPANEAVPTNETVPAKPHSGGTRSYRELNSTM
jgi:hypothetical protein